MNQFEANIKNSFKINCKKAIRRAIQLFYLPAKDKGKKWYFSFLSRPVQKNYVFYEAFAGLGILDNPRAIFKYLLSQEDFQDFVHIWSVDNITLAADNLKEFSFLDNVKIVQKESKEYYLYLATSKYLISNSTFGYYFEKRSEQIYINTWHGVPTKYMGYEHVVERVENARGPARNFLAADYLISANRFMTDVMYRRSYKLDGLFEGNLLEVGYPRLDAVIRPDTSAVSEKLNALGIKTDKKIILYAPTWKGNLYNQLEYNVDEFKNIVENLSSGIDRQQYHIYLRVHYFLYKILATDPSLKKLLIPFTIDTNELLSMVDILISDYSSIFFDFLPTGRPMLFYVPDLEQYRSGRGLYVPVDTLPGLVSSNLQTISDALGELCRHPAQYPAHFQSLHHTMRDWCTYNDNGDACKHLVDIIFRGNEVVNAPQAIIHGMPTKKKRVLICVNTRYNSYAFLEEFQDSLSEINFETTDVTILTTSFKDEKLKSYFHHLPDEVRILVWYALPFVTKEDDSFFAREVVRTLGHATFDEVRIAGNITPYWADFANAVNGFIRSKKTTL